MTLLYSYSLSHCSMMTLLSPFFYQYVDEYPIIVLFYQDLANPIVLPRLAKPIILLRCC